MRPPEVLVAAKKPWVLLDEILCIDRGHRIRARKYISASDFFLIGHFPESSVFPGVMMLAAFRQAAELLLSEQPGMVPGAPTRVREVQLRLLHPVVQGDVLELAVERVEPDVWRAEATAGGRNVARATFSLAPVGGV